jgi:hypothetical protein
VEGVEIGDISLGYPLSWYLSSTEARIVSGSRWLRKPPAATNLRPSSYVPVQIRWNHREFALDRTTYLAFPWDQPCFATRSQHPTLRAVREYVQVRVAPSRERNMSQDLLGWKQGGIDQGVHEMSFEGLCNIELAAGLHDRLDLRSFTAAD